MSLYYLVGLSLLLYGQTACAQFFYPFSAANNNFGLCSTNQNRQCANPAAFAADDPRGSDIQLLLPISVPDILSLQVGNYFARQKMYAFQYASAIWTRVTAQYRLSGGLALRLSPQFQLGLAIQVRCYQQPQFYGSVVQFSARLGFQYQFNKQHQLAMVLDDIAAKQLQTLKIEHLWCVSSQVGFAQGFIWNPTQTPLLYLSLKQALGLYHIQFDCAIPNTEFQLGITHSITTHWKLQFAQSWQKGIGYMVQLSFRHS